MARPAKTRTEPAFIVPMAAQPVTQVPEGDDWIYEIKLDGYRALLLKDGLQVQIRSRNDKDLTRTYPTIASSSRNLKAETAVIDGEIVVLGPDGKPSFQALQHVARTRSIRSSTTPSTCCTSMAAT